MKRLIRRDRNFAEFLGVKAREQRLAVLDARILALQSARRAAEETDARRVSHKESKNVRRFCEQHGWSEEDVANMIVMYKSQASPATSAPAASSSRASIVTGLGRVSQALFL